MSYDIRMDVLMFLPCNVKFMINQLHVYRMIKKREKNNFKVRTSVLPLISLLSLICVNETFVCH